MINQEIWHTMAERPWWVTHFLINAASSGQTAKHAIAEMYMN